MLIETIKALFQEVDLADQNIIQSPIYLVSDNTDLSIDQRISLTAFEKEWIKTQSVHNNPLLIKNQAIIFIPNPSGKLAKIIVGINTKQLTFALGKLFNSLPEGTYQIDNIEQFDLKAQYQLFLGFGLGAYQYNEFKKNSSRVVKLVIPKHFLSMRYGALNLKDHLYSVLNATFLTRNLVNCPPNVLTTDCFVGIAQDIANRLSIQSKVLKGEALLKENFPLIYHVGKAGSSEPYLVELKYCPTPQNQPLPKLTIIGKGVCFDTGGLDLKPASGMRFMKKDMAGAAQALALGQLIVENKWPIDLTILLPIVENSVSSNAFRPSDIITSRSGLTIEIDNTDAEGRLILADAITYACENNPDLIIDFATLTGAARVALGTDLPALFSNDNQLATLVVSKSTDESDEVWQMPLFQPYKEMFSSKNADLMNCSPQPYGGAITAALFLEAFVKEGIPWMHLDFMGYNLKSSPCKPEGGEAMGLRAFYSALSEYFSLDLDS